MKGNNNDKDHKAIFLPLGMALGISLGIFLDELPIGLCFGVMIGIVADYIINNKNKDK